jgi:5-(carboxyamino)imidazole ribonucleotide synthase
MVNFIGKVPALNKLKSYQDGHFHDYGKVARSGRKVGHFTIVASDKNSVEIEAADIVVGLENGSLY